MSSSGLKSRREHCVNLSHDILTVESMTSIPQICVTNWLTRHWLMVYILPLLSQWHIQVDVTISGNRSLGKWSDFLKITQGTPILVKGPPTMQPKPRHQPFPQIKLGWSWEHVHIWALLEATSVDPHTHPTQNQDTVLEPNPHTTSPLHKTMMQKSKEYGFIVLKALLHLLSLDAQNKHRQPVKHRY